MFCPPTDSNWHPVSNGRGRTVKVVLDSKSLKNFYKGGTTYVLPFDTKVKHKGLIFPSGHITGDLKIEDTK